MTSNFKECRIYYLIIDGEYTERDYGRQDTSVEMYGKRDSLQVLKWNLIAK